MLYSEIKNNLELIHNLTVKSYLPIFLKSAIIHGINNDNYDIDGLIKTCIIQRDSTWCIHYANLEVSKFYLIMLLYTDILLDVGETIFATYDFFMENHLYDVVLSRIQDMDFLNTLIDKEMQQHLTLKNSLEYVIGDAVSKLIGKIPDAKGMDKLIKSIPAMINKIRPENIDIIRDMIKKG